MGKNTYEEVVPDYIEQAAADIVQVKNTGDSLRKYIREEKERRLDNILADTIESVKIMRSNEAERIHTLEEIQRMLLSGDDVTDLINKLEKLSE